MDDETKTATEQRNHGEIHEGDGTAHGVSHREREDQHERRTDGDADDEHERLLDVGDVGGEACDQRGAGEAVDVGERERLDLVEEVVTEVLGESTARVATGNARSGTEQQRYESDDDEDPGRGQDLGDRCAVFDDVDEVAVTKGIAISQATSNNTKIGVAIVGHL